MDKEGYPVVARSTGAMQVLLEMLLKEQRMEEKHSGLSSPRALQSPAGVSHKLKVI